MRTRPLRRVLLILVSFMGALMSILVFLQGYALAQDDPHEEYRIYRDTLSLVNISWSSDGDDLVYQVDGGNIGAVTLGEDTWHQYSVDTEQTTDSDIWPLQPYLTPTQQTTFELYSDPNYGSFVFMSPNGRYIVYGGQTAETEPLYLPLSIADIVSNQHHTVPGIWIQNTRNFGFSHVRWSADSSAFTLENFVQSGEFELYHISTLNNINNVTIQTLHENLVVSGTPFIASRIYDISADGSEVLLYGVPRLNDSPFVAWDVATQSGAPIPVDGVVAGGAFSNLGQVLFVDEGGLKSFYRANNHVTTLNPAISSLWGTGRWDISGVFFSPDMQKVAVYSTGESQPDALYVLPIADRGLALFRPDTRETSLLQTLDTNPAQLQSAVMLRQSKMTRGYGG